MRRALGLVGLVGALVMSDVVVAEGQVKSNGSVTDRHPEINEDSLVFVTVGPGVSLKISYVDGQGQMNRDVWIEDSMVGYPSGLNFQYELEVGPGRRGAVILGDSILPNSGMLLGQAGQILRAESAKVLDWQADSALLTPIYQKILAKPTRLGLADLKKKEDKVRAAWGVEGSAVVKMMRFFANPDLLADTLIKLDVVLPGPAVFADSPLKDRIKARLALPEERDASEVLGDALGRCFFIIETVAFLGDKMMASDVLAVKKSQACQEARYKLRERLDQKSPAKVRKPQLASRLALILGS